MVLAAALVVVLGGPQNATPFLTLVGTIAIPTLFSLFKLEQTSQQNTELHQKNLDKLDDLKAEINK